MHDVSKARLLVALAPGGSYTLRGGKDGVDPFVIEA
jgi:hypothetical protein